MQVQDAAVPPAVVAAAFADTPMSASCAALLRVELETGQAQLGTCELERQRVTRAALAKAGRPRPVFGVVEFHNSTTDRAELTLALAERCRRWPLRAAQRRVITVADTQHLRCRLRRFDGELTIDAIDTGGRRHAALLTTRVEEGRVVLRYVELDRVLRALGHDGLDDFDRLELGVRGWAGAVNLVRLRVALANLHVSWVRQGRGVPALFALRHARHPEAQDVRVLANEADLIRQERDYRAVVAGQLSPLDFLERHPSSSYGLEVARLADLPISTGEHEPAAAREPGAPGKPGKPGKPGTPGKPGQPGQPAAPTAEARP